MDLSLKLELPPADTAQTPVAVSVTRDYADFYSSYHFAGHTLTAERILNFKMRELPASRTSDYLAFARAVNNDENQPLVVENSTSGAPEIPAAAKPADLFEAGLAALNSGNMRAAIPLFQRVVALDPKYKQAWNDLGLAYLRVGQYDDAAAAFRKQLDVDPFDEHAYDYLGLALEKQQKYPEAIAAFRKQVEVNPLDLIAHAALGSIFLEQHLYPDAVPELEKATILSPDNAELQVSLGRAYINTRRKRKRRSPLSTRPPSIAQTPAVWNNIAYNLADNKIELDKAAAIRRIGHLRHRRRSPQYRSPPSHHRPDERSREHRRLLGYAWLGLFREGRHAEGRALYPRGLAARSARRSRRSSRANLRKARRQGSGRPRVCARARRATFRSRDARVA